MYLRKVDEDEFAKQSNMIEDNTVSLVETFLVTHADIIGQAIKEDKILIYDEIDFTHFYHACETSEVILKFLDSIKADIFLPIYENEKLLVVLSKNSINSEWVKTEIGKAFKKGEEIGSQVLFPISLLSYEKLKNWENFDADYGRDLAKVIREFFVPNFENWRDEAEYKENFDRLVESLRMTDD